MDITEFFFFGRVRNKLHRKKTGSLMIHGKEILRCQIFHAILECMTVNSYESSSLIKKILSIVKVDTFRNTLEIFLFKTTKFRPKT